MKRRKIFLQAFCCLLILLLIVFLILPVIKVCIAGVKFEEKWDFFFLFNAFRRTVYLKGFLNSFLVAFSVTLLSIIISLPLAFLTTRCDFRGKGLLSALLFAPVILPPFVGALGVRKIFATDGGALNLILEWLSLIDPLHPPNWMGEHIFLMVVFLETLHLYPIMLLNAQASIANVDPASEEAARNLGASPWKVFFRITLPLARGGIFAGGTIVFIWSFTELGTPLMFDWTEVTPVEIFRGLQSIDIKPQPYVLVMLMLIISSAIYISGKKIFGRSYDLKVGKGAGNRQVKKLGWFSNLLVVAAILIISGISLLPHIYVILTSFAEAWYETILPEKFTLKYHLQLFHDETAVTAVTNSLKYSSISVAVDLLFGIPASYLIIRSRVAGRKILDVLCMLPLAIPGIVMAFGYLAMTRPGEILFFLNPKTSNPTPLLVIAYAARRLPFIVRGTEAGLQQIPASFEESARNLGAGPLRAFCKITLPLISANIIASATLAFSFAMLEVSDSLILAFWQEDYPITKAIWEMSYQITGGENLSCCLGVWGMLLLLLSLLVAWKLMGRKMTAIFRA